VAVLLNTVLPKKGFRMVSSHTKRALKSRDKTEVLKSMVVQTTDAAKNDRTVRNSVPESTAAANWCRNSHRRVRRRPWRDFNTCIPRCWRCPFLFDLVPRRLPVRSHDVHPCYLVSRCPASRCQVTCFSRPIRRAEIMTFKVIEDQQKS